MEKFTGKIVEETLPDAAHILDTPRLVLREFSLNDADALGNILSDLETMRFYPAPLNRFEVDEWIARNRRRYARDGHGLWAMVLRTTGELIGDCGLLSRKSTVQPKLRSATTFGAITGDKAWQQKLPVPAATSDSRIFPSSV